MNIKFTISKLTTTSLFQQFLLRHVLLLLLLLAVTSSFAQPANDDCSGAITLTVGTECSYNIYDNIGATNSSVGYVPGCVSNPKKDVWFKATVPSTGSFVIRGETSTNPVIVLTAYTGSCNNLTLYDCTYTVQSGGYLSLFINAPDKVGQDIYIRVVRYNSTTEASFKICAFEQTRPLNDDCGQAIMLSNETGTFSYTEYTNEFASSSTEGGTPTCGFYDGADVWFTTIMPSSGRLVINAKSDDIDPVFVVYTGTCSALISYECVTGSSGETELNLNDPTTLADQQIYIRLFGYYDDYGGTFDLLILEPAQDISSEAKALDVGVDSENYMRYTNKYATQSTDGGTPDCGLYVDKDIWFKMDVPTSGKLTIDSKSLFPIPQAVMPVFTVYTGSPGSLVEYDCNYYGKPSSEQSANPFGAKITIDDSGLISETIYLRMYNKSSATGGAFDLSVYDPNPAALPVDLVHFTAKLINAEVLLNWATASELNNDYFLVEHSTDGRNFIPMSHIAGKGTTESFQQYNFTDEEPFFGDNYYRLKQVDFDGSFEYSAIVIATIHLDEEQVKLFPNPAFTKAILTLQWAEDYKIDELKISIIDALGRQVYAQEIERGSETQTIIDCGAAKMDAGIYYMQLSNQQQVIAYRRFNLVKD